MFFLLLTSLLLVVVASAVAEGDTITSGGLKTSNSAGNTKPWEVCTIPIDARPAEDLKSESFNPITLDAATPRNCGKCRSRVKQCVDDLKKSEVECRQIVCWSDKDICDGCASMHCLAPPEVMSRAEMFDGESQDVAKKWRA